MQVAFMCFCVTLIIILLIGNMVVSFSPLLCKSEADPELSKLSCAIVFLYIHHEYMHVYYAVFYTFRQLLSNFGGHCIAIVICNYVSVSAFIYVLHSICCYVSCEKCMRLLLKAHSHTVLV